MNNKSSRSTVYTITKIALLAALFVTLILTTAPIAYGPIQVRIANALCLLPYFLGPWALIGNTIGITIANLLGPFGVIDALFGFVNTLTTGILICKSPNIYVAAIWPVIYSPLIVAYMLNKLVFVPYAATYLYVAIGQAISMIIGVPVLLYINKKVNLSKYR